MNINDYRVAIPSYKRAETLRDKTLNVLEKHEINPARVTIFVASEEEKEKYQKAISPTIYANSDIVVGVPGMGAIRRFIQNYYEDGTLVMNFDDDLQEVLIKESDKKMIPVENLERDVIIRGFQACKDNDAYLFGIYAAANAMFMKHRIAVGLYYCIGSCWGIVNRRDSSLSVTLDDKEDYERTLQHFVKDGKVIRLDDITVKSKYYTEDGGMQVTRTDERIFESAKELERRYPSLCKMYIRGTTGHAELRLNSRAPASTSTLEDLFG